MRLIGFAIYLGIGAMLHAVFQGSQFDWTSAWTFGWLFGWPIMLVMTFGVAIIGIIIGLGLLVALWNWIDTIAAWRERRRKQGAR